jgi:hypothetical protein
MQLHYDEEGKYDPLDTYPSIYWQDPHIVGFEEALKKPFVMPKVDWSMAHEDAMWWGITEWGRSCFYESKPTADLLSGSFDYRDHKGMYWEAGERFDIERDSNGDIKNWYRMIIKRPETE